MRAMPTDAIRGRLAGAVIALAAALGACATPTLEDEAEIGRKMNAQVYQDLVIVHDDVLNTYIDAIGQRLLRAAGPQPYDYTHGRAGRGDQRLRDLRRWMHIHQMRI